MGCSVIMPANLNHQKAPLNCPQKASQRQVPSLPLDPWSLLSVGESVNKSAITSPLSLSQSLSQSLSLCVCLSLPSLTWPPFCFYFFILSSQISCPNSIFALLLVTLHSLLLWSSSSLPDVTPDITCSCHPLHLEPSIPQTPFSPRSDRYLQF